jgi:hypothetical protein
MRARGAFTWRRGSACSMGSEAVHRWRGDAHQSEARSATRLELGIGVVIRLARGMRDDRGRETT